MWRFAAAITLVEIALTALSAALITMDFDPDPYLSADDLRNLGLPFENHATQRRMRFDALLGYDSSMALLNPRQSASVSVRVEQTRVDFDARRRREENWATKPGFGRSTVSVDPGHEDEGFMVRHASAKDVRCELVRFRGDRMVIVRVSRGGIEGDADEELAACERRARILQGRILSKIRWWSPLRAGRR